MHYPEFHYSWEWRLRSTPEQLWPFVTDTNRFNRDVGLPAVHHADDETRENARQNLRLIETLEDLDDVQRVTANFEIPDEVFAEATA